MPKKKLLPVSKLTLKIQREFDQWRSDPARLKQTRIPDRLWEMACLLAQEVPISLVVDRLKVNRKGLLAQLDRRKSLGVKPKNKARRRVSKAETPAFVQVSLPSAHLAQCQDSPPRIEVEWLDAYGRSVRLRATLDAFRQILFQSDSERPLSGQRNN